MALKADLESEVAEIFKNLWTERDGTVVPSDDSIKLGNDAVKLKGTVLYADLNDSTKLVDHYKTYPAFAAEIYKTYLHCAGKIIRGEGGSITAYDGDRVMAIFIGDRKNTSAVKAAMKINYAVQHIINPLKNARYEGNPYVMKQVVGIDTSDLFVAKTGVRGANDLVWVGRAANHAAKLTTLKEASTYITKAVYDQMLDEVKFSNGINMWEERSWTAMDKQSIYRSNYWWTIP
jgi:class 3 adenylate cyclase